MAEGRGDRLIYERANFVCENIFVVSADMCYGFVFDNIKKNDKP